MIKFMVFLPIGGVLLIMIGNELYLWFNRERYIEQGRKMGMDCVLVTKLVANSVNKYVLKGIKLGSKEREITDKLMRIDRDTTTHTHTH